MTDATNETLYRNMTPDQLRMQYNPSRSMAEAPKIFQSWKDRSAAFRAKAKAKLDIAYAEHPAARLDLFLPEKPTPRLHVYIHGGYWQAFGKNDFSFMAEGLVENGLAVAVLGYPLCPTVPMPMVIRHARLALAYLWRELENLGLKREKIQISGHSAGAHLCAMLMATIWPKFLPELPEDIVHSALLISGVYELEPLRFIETGRALQLTPELAKRVSPLYLKPATKARALLCTGGLESAEFKRQSAFFGRAWARYGALLEVVTFTNRNHFTVLDELAPPNSALVRRANDLLDF
jgi:arylformamidase